MSNPSPQPSKTTPSRSKSQSYPTDNVPACYIDTQGVITTTTNDIPGYRITKNLNTIYGLTVRSRNWGVDLGAFFKSSIGGELPMFTRLMYSARNEAMDRMVGECLGRGGNAVLGVRMDVVAEGVWCQVCAYGTAVFVERIREGEEVGVV